MYRGSRSGVFLGKGVSNFIEIAFRHGCSPVNLLHIFRKPFPRNISGWLLLYVVSNSKLETICLRFGTSTSKVVRT